jgi:mono/diheme cytochrome c family protein
MRRMAYLVLTCVFALPACGDDDGGGSDDGDDDGDDGAIDAAPEADAAVDGGSPVVERGSYLVNVVGACNDCHTPRNKDGSFDETRFLGGNPSFVDVAPKDDTMGNLPVPNLTADATGLADWTDDEIKDAFLNGNGRGDDALFPVMPYYVLHNMSDDDADAIVAYLRTLDPVDQEIEDPQPPFSLIVAPAPAFPVESIPDHSLAKGDPDFEAAEQGRYLAGNIGLCMECHTRRTDEMDPSSLDLDLLFVGNNPFQIGAPFPDIVYSANITPDEKTGIGGWTATQVRVALKEGTDIEGEGLCPPMPAGPMGPFAGFTDEDAEAIGTYLLNIEPIAGAEMGECAAPPAVLAQPAHGR